MAPNSKKTKGFHMPHVFIILLLIMLFVVALSYIIPSGMYDRLERCIRDHGDRSGYVPLCGK